MKDDTKPSSAAMKDDADVAVVVVNYRTPELTRKCLLSLMQERRKLPNLRAVVVDGGSADGSAEVLQELASTPDLSTWVSCLPLKINGGFGWANNQAILMLAGEERPPEFIYLLNPDAQIRAGAIWELVRELRSDPRVAAAGSKLLQSDGSPAASAFRFPAFGRELVSAVQSEKIGRLLGIAPVVVQVDDSAEVDWVTGASVLLRSVALQEVGLFDDGFFLYFEEVELMHRLRTRGWKTRHVPRSEVFHIEGAATGLGSAEHQTYPSYWYESRRRYFALTGQRLAVTAANAGWVAGRILAFFKRCLGRPVSSRARISGVLRFPFAASDDLEPSVPAWGDPPGRNPAWMEHQ